MITNVKNIQIYKILDVFKLLLMPSMIIELAIACGNYEYCINSPNVAPGV